MRVLIVTNIPTPYRNAFFSVLSRKLNNSGGKLMVLFCAKNEPNRHWEINMNSQEFDFEFLKGMHIYFKHYFLHFNPAVTRKTEVFRPDIILYAGAWNMLTVIYSIIHNKIFRKKWKVLFWNEGHEGSILHKWGIVPKIRLHVLNIFDGFAVPNNRSISYLFDYLKVRKKPVVLLSNTVDGDFYTKPSTWNESDTLRVKDKYKLDAKSNICIQVAQIEDRKGVRELIDFWQNLPNEIKEDYCLLFVGEGSLRSELERYCKKNNLNDIIFTGNRTKEEVRELLFASRFFILMTKNDPNPLTLIEASYAGLPIMTTIFAGNCDEIVFKDQNGYIADNINFSEFNNAFIKLKYLSSKPESGLISLNNAKQNFDINIVAQKFLAQITRIS
jgi:glycosyltransferase involved in cell wall biosynthesis